MSYRPPRRLGTIIGGAMAVWSFVLMSVLLGRGLTLSISLTVLGPYLAAAAFFFMGCLFTYWSFGCQTLRYSIDRNGLIIHWGLVRQLIPMDQIERLVPGRRLPEPRIEGVSWLGHHVGRARVEGLGDTLLYATHRSHDDLLYVVTPSQSYGLSVEDEAMFARELQARRAQGALYQLRQGPERQGLAAHPFWADRLAQGLAAGAILVCVLLFAIVFGRYPALSDTMPLSFPSLGGITRIASKEELLTLPTTAFGVLLVNLILGYALHAWERLLGYLLFIGAIGLQLTFLAGAIIALSWQS
jgi:hypothetical protein